ncbi:MAG: methyltransferase domain-containing protein [Candidatus Nomurabacteria bacterium]|nr:methyltransferase domain-containing protein [Candidatus Nomurabacteria bacterium]USN87431.1 MAG: methyltransferase domain-containing protein [Candidatus Nomurabacteria bacterium]
MNEWLDNKTIAEYAEKAVDRDWAWYEYEVNFPDLVELLPADVGSMLDFGCGTGEFTSLLTEKADSVIGTDVAPMIDMARIKNPEVKFVVWDGNDSVPYELGVYDVIFAKLSLQFIEDLESTVKRLYKITKTDGFLIVSVPNPDKICKQFSLESVDNKRYQDEIGDTGIKINPVHRSETEYLRIFRSVGFEVVEVSKPMIPEELCLKYDAKNGEYSSRLNLKLRKV